MLETATSKRIKWPLEDEVSNEDLQNILFHEKYASMSGYMEPDYERIHTELAKPGVTLTLLWAEYNEKCISAGKRPYMTTQFGDKYRRWVRITKAMMRIHQKPGDAMEVDWAGQTLPVYDAVTSEISKAYLFVDVLP